MTLSRELMLAILSMDSYNRGYGVGLNFRQPSNQIGNASTITFPDNVSAGWEAAGFYAIAYDMTGVSGFANGERVISYRGSDYEDTRGFPSVLSNDIWQGWTNAVGYPFGGQPRLALDFYRAVTGTEPYNTPGNYTITGHSLGGSLAGFVSALSGNQAVLFDHIPFGIAAYLQATFALGDVSTVRYGLPSAYHVSGEVAGGARAGGLSYIAALPIAALAGIPGWAIAGTTTAGVTIALEASVDNTEIGADVDLGSLDIITRHSMALMVTLMWAEQNADSRWIYAADDILTAYFSQSLARSFPGYSALKGENSSEGYVMQSAIAYSALDEGDDDARPFGDVAIRAMFDDAGDFGTVLQAGQLPAWLGEGANAAIGRIIVEFAGLMALRDAQRDTGQGLALNGVITNNYSNQGAITAMRISFGDELWGLGGDSIYQSAERTGLINSAVDASISGAQLERVTRWYRESASGNLLHDIDEVIFGFSGAAYIAAANDNVHIAQEQAA